MNWFGIGSVSSAQIGDVFTTDWTFTMSYSNAQQSKMSRVAYKFAASGGTQFTFTDKKPANTYVSRCLILYIPSSHMPCTHDPKWCGRGSCYDSKNCLQYPSSSSCSKRGGRLIVGRFDHEGLHQLYYPLLQELLKECHKHDPKCLDIWTSMYCTHFVCYSFHRVFKMFTQIMMMCICMYSRSPVV